MTFTVGQKVVYPNHGVSRVEEISAATFDDVEHTLYHLRLLSNNSKVMVPEDNLDLVGLRPLGDETAIKALIGILEDGNIETYKDWKGRYKQNLDKMKTGELPEVAEVLKNLCLVSQKKSLSFREKKMYERAKYFIVSEIAHVKEITEEQADELVDEALQLSLKKLEKAKAKAAEAEEAKEAKNEAGADGADTDGVADSEVKSDSAADGDDSKDDDSKDDDSKDDDSEDDDSEGDDSEGDTKAAADDDEEDDKKDDS